MKTPENRKGIILARCIRTAMCGGGTSYDVYWRTKDKPSRPLHNGHIYAAAIHRGDGEFYRTVDAIDPRSRWEMPGGLEKYDARITLERKADRLAVRKAALARLRAGSPAMAAAELH